MDVLLLARAKLGLPAGVIQDIGDLLLVLTVVYVIPPTSISAFWFGCRSTSGTIDCAI